MKLLILGGFLGSGKTSILIPAAKAIVNAEGGGDKTRVAIVENEIGQVGIDTAFTDDQGFSTTEMFNGCVCCTLASTLMETLCKLQQDVDPEWVILEATGLARPHDIAESVLRYYDENMTVASCITVDAKRWNKIKRVAEELAFEQVKYADYVLINKTDLVDRDTVEGIEAELKSISGGRVLKISAFADPEGTALVCKDIVNEIKSL